MISQLEFTVSQLIVPRESVWHDSCSDAMSALYFWANSSQAFATGLAESEHTWHALATQLTPKL